MFQLCTFSIVLIFCLFFDYPKQATSMQTKIQLVYNIIEKNTKGNLFLTLAYVFFTPILQEGPAFLAHLFY